MKPGDEAPAGTPRTGQTVSRRCGGSGRLGTAACPDCRGTGVVAAIVGGA
jgi:DnaJ-class molecular chaperone